MGVFGGVLGGLLGGLGWFWGHSDVFWETARHLGGPGPHQDALLGRIFLKKWPTWLQLGPNLAPKTEPR